MLRLKVLDRLTYLLQVHAPNATSEYQVFVVKFFYEYHLLSLWGILTLMLEQTQIRGRVWSENMESLD